MDEAIAMQVLFWWALAQFGSLLIKTWYSRSTLGTRYQTEKKCEECRNERDKTREADNADRGTELRKIRLLLIQVALRQGVDVETIEEVIK
jgi:uncharacterized membrane protein